MIKLNSKRPVFFTQMRIGRDNELFKFYKILNYFERKICIAGWNGNLDKQRRDFI